MVRVKDYVGKTKPQAEAMAADQGLEVVINAKPNYTQFGDTVESQNPAAQTDVPENTVVNLVMSGVMQGVNIQQGPMPQAEHYLPHGREPVMATLMIRSKVPVQLDLVVTPNVSFTVSTMKEQKIETDGSDARALGMTTPKAAAGRTIPA